MYVDVSKGLLLNIILIAVGFAMVLYPGSEELWIEVVGMLLSVVGSVYLYKSTRRRIP